MRRIVWGFGIAPLVLLLIDILSTGSPVIALFDCIEAYVAILILGLPIFVLLAKLKWLRLWQLILAGAVVSASLAWLMDSPFLIPLPSIIEMDGLTDIFSGAGFGCAMTLVFWFIAVYRNEYFPFAPSTFPFPSLILGAGILGISLYVAVATRRPLVHGEIVALSSPEENTPMAQARLDSGEMVKARLFCYRLYAVGDKVTLSHRSKHPFIQEIYWITAGDVEKSHEEVHACVEEEFRWYKGTATKDDYPKL